jgi:hypothetical protein
VQLLYDANGDGDFADAGESTLVATDTTSGGFMVSRICPGNYEVVIPLVNFRTAGRWKPSTWSSTVKRWRRRRGDGDGSQPGGAGRTQSGLIVLVVGDEPTVGVDR